MLKLKDVYKTFNRGTVNEKKAIDGLNLTLEDGDFVTVIGGNGAGKSTTLNLIAGVFPVDSGKIVLNGLTLNNLPEHKRARFLGRVFQDPMRGTAATMGIEENLALAYRRGKMRGLSYGITNEERKIYRERLATLGLGLEDRMTSKVGLLSGGQRQRALIAMVIAQDTDYVLLDEPTNNLDIYYATNMMKIVRRLCDELGKTVILVLHEINYAAFYSDYICAFKDGKIAKFGTAEEVMTKENLSEIYQVDFEILNIKGKPLSIYY